jgi:hypothetical protein
MRNFTNDLMAGLLRAGSRSCWRGYTILLLQNTRARPGWPIKRLRRAYELLGEDHPRIVRYVSIQIRFRTPCLSLQLCRTSTQSLRPGCHRRTTDSRSTLERSPSDDDTHPAGAITRRQHHTLSVLSLGSKGTLCLYSLPLTLSLHQILHLNKRVAPPGLVARTYGLH